MRPLNIEISGFGPYKDKVSVSFSNFGSSGIFLITGPTGAGKTSIFDAIVFALFGEASGSNRDINSIRSNFSPDDIKTYVILKFIHKDKIYEIYRKPAYERKKKRNDGVLVEPADAYLKYDDVVINKVKNVNEKIEDILGINVKQFKQISMLAQGEFLKILYADSKERTEIFRKIFDTDIYNRITYKLKDMKKIKEDKLEKSRIEIISKLSDVNYIVSSNSKLNEIELKEFIDKIKSDIDIKEKQDKEFNDELTKKEQELKKLDNEISKLESLNKKIVDFNDTKNKLEQLKMQEEKINIDKEIIKKNQEIIIKIEPLKKDLNLIKADIEKNKNNIASDQLKLKELNRTKEEIDNRLNKTDNLNDKIKQYNDSLDKLNKYNDDSKLIEKIEDSLLRKNKLLDINKNLLDKQSKISEINKLVFKYNDNLKDIEKLESESNNIKNFLTLYETKKKLSSEYNKLNKDYMDIITLYNKENDLYFKNQASILALNLEENTPCPVCGSLTHPHIASISTKVLSKDELDKLKIKVDDALEKLNKNKSLILINDKSIKELSINVDNIDTYNNDINEKLNICTEEKNSILCKYRELYSIFSNKNVDIEDFSYDMLINQVSTELNENNLLIGKIDGFIDNSYNEIKNTYNMSYDLFKNKILVECSNINKILKELLLDIEKIYFELENSEINLKTFNIEEYIKRINDDRMYNLNEIAKYSALVVEHNRLYDDNNNKFNNVLNSYKKQALEFGYDSTEMLEDDLVDEIELNKLIKKCDSYRENLISLNSKYEILCHDIEGKEYIDLNHLKLSYKDMESNIIKDRNVSKNLFSELNKFREKYNYLNNIYDKYLEYIIDFNDYDLLYRTASGTLNGKNRIEFEQYVQGTYFDMIIMEANKRLNEMTDGRYLLLRKKKASKLTDKIGLELEVFDNYNGKNRDIKSLSGGESFKASLSLALGLSDIIQSYKGGIVIDTLFIDEGFATLDDESRNEAINTLNNLSNNKLIGIISHVNELKERINNKIIIEKTKVGSSIKIEV